MQMTLLPLGRDGRWLALVKSREDRTRFARGACIKEFLIKVRLLNALIQNKYSACGLDQAGVVL